MNNITGPTGPLGAVDISLEELSNRWGRLLALGIVMVIAGFVAIVFPVVATLATELALGAIFLVAGAVEVAHSLELRRTRGFWLAVLLGGVTVGVGVLLLLFPLSGVLSLTMVVAILFLVTGLLRITAAIRLRPGTNWGILMISGVLALLLGVLVLSQWPEAAIWLLGVLVGIDLIFAGWWMVYVALAARRVKTTEGVA